MKRISFLFVVMMCSLISFSQKTDMDPNQPGNLLDKGKMKQQIALKNRNLKEDKTESIDVTGINGGSFSTLNYPDGSSRNNSLEVKSILKLTVSNANAGSYQLVFYNENEKPAYAFEQNEGVTSVYFPQSSYESIRQKIEQSFSSKRKVQLKMTSNPNGYKEATISF